MVMRSAWLVLALVACRSEPSAPAPHDARVVPRLPADAALEPRDAQEVVADASAPADAAVPARFRCGKKSCPEGKMCSIMIGGAYNAASHELPEEDRCLPFPAECAKTPTCGCLIANNYSVACEHGHPIERINAP